MRLLARARVAALHGLDRADHLLTLGAGQDALDAALAPDMPPFGDQIAFAASFARRSVLPLLDGPFDPDLDWVVSEPSLRDLLSTTRLEIVAAEGGVRARVAHRAGEAELDQSADDYLVTFALPNLWFHVTMAYAILRARGAPVGKADFDGFHVYGRA
jgi:hypothetical protein